MCASGSGAERREPGETRGQGGAGPRHRAGQVQTRKERPRVRRRAAARKPVDRAAGASGAAGLEGAARGRVAGGGRGRGPGTAHCTSITHPGLATPGPF